MLRLAMLNPLRVELVLPASRYGTVTLRDEVSVTPDLPGATPLTARVTHVDKLIDAASNTFRVRMKLPNPGNKLPAGARCRVDLAPTVAATPHVTPQATPQVTKPAPAAEAQPAKGGQAPQPKAAQTLPAAKVTG